MSSWEHAGAFGVDLAVLSRGLEGYAAPELRCRRSGIARRCVRARRLRRTSRRRDRRGRGRPSCRGLGAFGLSRQRGLHDFSGMSSLAADGTCSAAGKGRLPLGKAARFASRSTGRSCCSSAGRVTCPTRALGPGRRRPGAAGGGEARSGRSMSRGSELGRAGGQLGPKADRAPCVGPVIRGSMGVVRCVARTCSAGGSVHILGACSAAGTSLPPRARRSVEQRSSSGRCTRRRTRRPPDRSGASRTGEICVACAPQVPAVTCPSAAEFRRFLARCVVAAETRLAPYCTLVSRVGQEVLPAPDPHSPHEPRRGGAVQPGLGLGPTCRLGRAALGPDCGMSGDGARPVPLKYLKNVYW